MAFTATPVDGSPIPIPMSSAVPDGTNTPLAIEGGPAVATGGNSLVPVSVYEKDGNNIVLGTTTDANTVNSVMGRLTKIRDLLNATLPVSVTNANANGQATMANSSPVVLASDHFGQKTMANSFPVTLASDQSTSWGVKAQATSAGGTSEFHLVAAGSNNATNIKASAGQIYGYEIFNASAAVRYVKLYNKSTAPAPATDNALLKRTIGIPAGQRASFHSSTGISCSAGIGIAMVTGISDTDNTAVTASDLVVDIDWI
jgi:hypothetical protein